MKFINGVTNYSEWRNFGKDNKKTIERKAIIEACLKAAELTFSDELKLVQAVNVSELSGKLEGFYSVSTSVLMNKRCQMRARIEGSICKECYAANNVARYSGLTQALECNYRILNTWLISDTAWSFLPFPSTNGKARIESHGDVETVTCARNYIRIIRTHKHLVFGVWTKNLDVWHEAFKIEGKPENMTFIVSSPMLNEVVNLPEFIKPYTDHVFTVYDKEHVERNGISVNCGARDCNACMRCYTLENREFQIAELLK